jgi:hypothetical protein
MCSECRPQRNSWPTLPGVPHRLYPKVASTAAYIRQRGVCGLCGDQLCLSGARYYAIFPPEHAYWTRRFRSLSAATRMACVRCAPDEARPRHLQLVHPSRLGKLVKSAPDVVSYVRTNHARLSNDKTTESEKTAEYDAFKRVAPGSTVCRDGFIRIVWGTLREAPKPRADRTGTASCRVRRPAGTAPQA